MQNNNGNSVLALITGLALGAGMGILFAPYKGTETRKKIKDKATKVKSDIKEHVSHAKD